MRAGERRDGRFDDVPLLAAASARTRRRLAEHVERVRVPDGGLVLEQGRPVQWIPVAVDGALGGAGGRSWGPGEPVFLGEGLLHGIAPQTVRARGEVELLYLPIRALTAAVSTDPALGLAVARSLARSLAGAPNARPRRRRFEYRRLRPVTTVRPPA